MKIAKVAVNMIAGNDSKMSYLLNNYLRQEVIYAPRSQGQLPAAKPFLALILIGNLS